MNLIPIAETEKLPTRIVADDSTVQVIEAAVEQSEDGTVWEWTLDAQA